MKFCTYIKIRKTVLIIISPIIILYFSGLLGLRKYNEEVWKLHSYGVKNDMSNVWFAKKCMSMYMRVAMFSILNIVSWFLTIYYFTK